MNALRVFFVLFSASLAGAAVSLQVNGTGSDSIVLKTGQTVTVEVASSDTAIYNTYVGFADAASALGKLVFTESLPAAGNLAYVTEVTVPVQGYYVCSGGTSPAPSAGVHFRFSYTPETAGATTLLLYGKDGVKLLDEMIIFVEPAALGSAFTYQGRLLDNGEGRDGIYDFEFRLFDAPTAGNQFGQTNLGDDIEVDGGYFTAELDFGPDGFAGENTWLEVAVKEGFAKVPFTVLGPRQRLTATPNASFAARSDWQGLLNVPVGFADGVDNDTRLSESQVETYIANDLSTGAIPYDNGTQLADSGLQYSPADGTLKAGGVFNAERKFSIFSTTNPYALYVENTHASGLNVGIRAAAAGDTTNNSYGLWGTSSSSLGSNYGVFGTASAASPGTNYGVYGYAFNTGTGEAYAGYFSGNVKVTGPVEFRSHVLAAPSAGSTVSIGGSGSEGRKLSVFTDASPTAIYGESAGSGSESYGVQGIVNGDATGSGFGVYGSSSTTTGSNCGVFGNAMGNTSSNSYGLYGQSLSGLGDNYGVLGRANINTPGTNYGVYGYAAGGSRGSWAGYFVGKVHTTGDLYVGGNVSAASVTDRTPYPKDLATAVEAVMSMERLGDGQYDESNKEQQLDHSGLSDFVRSEDGKRDLSATVSCHNEVLKELLKSQEQVRQLQEENAAMKKRLAAVEAALNKMNLVP